MSASLGTFLTEKHVAGAIQLLKCQIESDSRTHRCLDLEILRRENKLSKLSKLCPKQFYSEFIRSDVCFNYPQLFHATPYYVPKGDGGVRQFHFCEVHLWILYYSIGFYFLDLTKAVRDQLRISQDKASFHTFYGANIRQDSPQNSQIHYQEDYQSFTSSIRKTVRQQVREHKVAVLHLDIQDFFRTIDHLQFTRVLNEQSLSESKLRLHYDEQTQSTIREILFLIVQRSEGLPLSQQNIVSNLLSHLFLYPLDCYIHEIQIDSSPSLTFHRYVDDMFITVQFPWREDNGKIGAEMLNIATRIGERLSSSLDLSLNSLKTRIDIISSEQEADTLIERSRLVSFYRPLPDDGSESPQVALKRATTILIKLNEAFHEHGYIARLDANDDIALKQCFHKTVVQSGLFHSKERFE